MQRFRALLPIKRVTVNPNRGLGVSPNMQLALSKVLGESADPLVAYTCSVVTVPNILGGAQNVLGAFQSIVVVAPKSLGAVADYPAPTDNMLVTSPRYLGADAKPLVDSPKAIVTLFSTLERLNKIVWELNGTLLFVIKTMGTSMAIL